MALWLTAIIALACLGGLASPVPVNHMAALRELIGDLSNITQNQAPLCNGSMVWSVNLTNNVYCAAMDALSNVSECSTIRHTKRLLSGLCNQSKATARVSPLALPHILSCQPSLFPSPGIPWKLGGDLQSSNFQVRDTKIELSEFVKQLLDRLRNIFRNGNKFEA
ncbi:interleukin-13 [Rhynchocyon petersi]